MNEKTTRLHSSITLLLYNQYGDIKNKYLSHLIYYDLHMVYKKFNLFQTKL